MLFLNTLIALACLSLAAIIDYHFTSVINYHARVHAKRIERERKERDKKARAEERYRSHSMRVIGQNDMNLDGSAVPNPIIVPEREPKAPPKTAEEIKAEKRKKKKQERKPTRQINGVTLPDGLEVPAHWKNDLSR